MIQTHLMPKWLPPWPCVEATTALSKGAPAPLPSRQFPVSALTSVFLVCLPSVQSNVLKLLITSCHLVSNQPGLASVGDVRSQDEASRITLLQKQHFEGHSVPLLSHPQPTPAWPSRETAIPCHICKLLGE